MPCVQQTRPSHWLKGLKCQGPRFAIAALLSAGASSMALAIEPVNVFRNPEAQKYVTQAFQAAGEDYLSEATSMCKPPAPPRPAGMPNLTRIKVFDATQVFDNVYYFGSTYVGATVVQTSDGLVLIDSLTNDEAAANELEAGMKKMGLDPAQIKYLVITHGHGDHYGGVRYLRAHYPNFRIVASEDDWTYMAKPGLMPDGSPDPSPKEPRASKDIGYADKYDLTLGDTSFHLIKTSGHTPGTTSLIYPVRQGGHTYNVMQWGGGNPSDSRFSLATVENYVAAAKSAKVAIRWGSHPRGDWINLRSQVHPISGDGPLIEGEAKLTRYLDVVLACKRAYAAEAGTK